MTKDELQLKVQNLETLLTSKEEETTTLNTQLSQARKVLADVSKPKINKETVDEIRDLGTMMAEGKSITDKLAQVQSKMQIVK